MLQKFPHSSQPRNIKLEKQAGLPTVKLLEEMMKKSMMASGALVELPFGDDAQSFNFTTMTVSILVWSGVTSRTVPIRYIR
jgi:hypothetical protein